MARGPDRRGDEQGDGHDDQSRDRLATLSNRGHLVHRDGDERVRSEGLADRRGNGDGDGGDAECEERPPTAHCDRQRGGEDERGATGLDPRSVAKSRQVREGGQEKEDCDAVVNALEACGSDAMEEWRL